MLGIGAQEWLVLIAVALFGAFWLWMLIDALIHESAPARRLFWVALIFLTSFPGALLYALLPQGRRGRHGASSGPNRL
jgi:heme O synthase-like polyprenyltransferase